MEWDKGKQDLYLKKKKKKRRIWQKHNENGLEREGPGNWKNREDLIMGPHASRHREVGGDDGDRDNGAAPRDRWKEALMELRVE